MSWAEGKMSWNAEHVTLTAGTFHPALHFFLLHGHHSTFYKSDTPKTLLQSYQSPAAHVLQVSTSNFSHISMLLPLFH